MTRPIRKRHQPAEVLAKPSPADEALAKGTPIMTTIAGARAAVQAINALRAGTWDVSAIQDYFPHLARAKAAPRGAELVAQ